MIHFPAVVCTNSPSTANNLWSLAAGQLHRSQLRSSTRILVEGFRARRRAECPVMIPVVAGSHQLPDGYTTTRVASRRLHTGNVFLRGRHTDAFPRLGRRAQLYGQAGMSRLSSHCRCGSDRPQSTPRRFRFGCVCAHSNFDGGQRDADCLTPQLRTNGRLADGMKGRESVRTDATCPHPVAAPRLVHGAAKTKH